jgi:hypothetical protein
MQHRYQHTLLQNWSTNICSLLWCWQGYWCGCTMHFVFVHTNSKQHICKQTSRILKTCILRNLCRRRTPALVMFKYKSMLSVSTCRVIDQMVSGRRERLCLKSGHAECWWEKWHWNRVSPSILVSSRKSHYTSCSRFINHHNTRCYVLLDTGKVIN